MNVEDFYDVNFRLVWDGAGPAIDVGPDTSKAWLKKSIQSGLTVDEEYEIFVRDSYGAAYGECPKKVVESPTVTQRLLGYKSVEEAYPSEVSEGAELVIGPGASIHGLEHDRLIYCRNYKEMIEKGKDKETSNGEKHR